MIYGIGTDICALSRIQAILKEPYAFRFVSRVLTLQEINKFNSLNEIKQTEYLASRFALKEAVSKALGTGIGSNLRFLDIEIANLPSGKPICNLSDEGYERLQLNKHNVVINISLSHEKEYVVAFVVIEQIKQH